MFIRIEDRLRARQLTVSCLHSSCRPAWSAKLALGAEDRRQALLGIRLQFISRACRQCRARHRQDRNAFACTCDSLDTALLYKLSNVHNRDVMGDLPAVNLDFPSGTLPPRLTATCNVWSTDGVPDAKDARREVLSALGQPRTHFAPAGVGGSASSLRSNRVAAHRIEWELLDHGHGSGIRKGVF